MASALGPFAATAVLTAWGRYDAVLALLFVVALLGDAGYWMELAELGLEDVLARVAVTTRESVFFNRYGQLIYREPAGRYAGYAWPQFSIHRGDLQQVLLAAFRARVGGDRLHTGWICDAYSQD